jgi:hypothetical protein
MNLEIWSFELQHFCLEIESSKKDGFYHAFTIMNAPHALLAIS